MINKFKVRAGNVLQEGCAITSKGEIGQLHNGEWMSCPNNIIVTVQNYTGLNDKYNQEIYEGDYLFVDGEVWEVEFRLGAFMIIQIDDKEEGMYGLLYEYYKDCGICGNKFEGIK